MSLRQGKASKRGLQLLVREIGLLMQQRIAEFAPAEFGQRICRRPCRVAAPSSAAASTAATTRRGEISPNLKMRRQSARWLRRRAGRALPRSLRGHHRETACSRARAPASPGRHVSTKPADQSGLIGCSPSSAISTRCGACCGQGADSSRFGAGVGRRERPHLTATPPKRREYLEAGRPLPCEPPRARAATGR